VALAAATASLAVLTASCGSARKSTRSAGAPAPPPEAVALRLEVDRLRAELVELRSLLETARRATAEQAERNLRTGREEIEAIRQALEATARTDLQRQVEVLDAQARRIDLLEQRTGDLAQTLHRVEVSLASVASELETASDETPGKPASDSARDGRRAAVAGKPTGGGGASAAAPAGSGAGPSGAAPAGGAPAVPAASGAALAPPALLGLPASGRRAVAPAPPAVSKPGERAPAAAAPAPAKPPPAAKPSQPASVAAAAKPPAPAGTAAAAQARAPAPLRASAGPVTSVTARVLFDRAMESWNKGEAGQAVLDLEDLVRSFPADPLVPAARFWIGEGYYTARDFERAAEEYARALELAPTATEAPRALLRLGLAYRAQRREAEARRAWARLLREFPQSDAAEEARRLRR
jgi:TolA-binding protein